MKWLSAGPANQTITLLLFMAASAVPLYSQEVRTSQKAQAAPAVSDQTSGEFKPTNAVSSRESSRQVVHADTNSNPPASAASQAKQASKPFVFPTRRERFNGYVKSTVGPSSFAGSAVKAGIDQWTDHPEEWEQGASGYGRRFASDFGRNAIQQTVVYGLDSALGLDTKFRRSTRKGFFPRMTDALAENVTSRNKSGKRVISVPRLSGVYLSRIIQTEAWYPERYSYKDGLRSGTHSLAIGFGINLLREFVIGR
jgi:hypothetical protein